MRPQPIRVVVLEDDPLLREILAGEIGRTPGLTCPGLFPTYEDAAPHLPTLRPDVVLLDLVLPGIHGVEACRALKARAPRWKVLVFTGWSEEELILRAFEAGADGYLLKTASAERLASAILRVYDGHSALDPMVADKLVTWFQRRQSLVARLSPIEREILEACDRGLSYKEIAALKGMSENTLKTHMKRILAKTFATSAAQASFIRGQAV